MREIKFRVWDKVAKNMFTIFDANEQKEWFPPKWKDRYEVMQYTGLKDGKDVEIYEGDIVEFARGRHQVGFLDGSFVLCDRNQWHIPFYTIHGGIEVIGSIYENPELI